jgi:hypothetical protein
MAEVGPPLPGGRRAEAVEEEEAARGPRRDPQVDGGASAGRGREADREGAEAGGEEPVARRREAEDGMPAPPRLDGRRRRRHASRHRVRRGFRSHWIRDRRRRGFRRSLRRRLGWAGARMDGGEDRV